MSLPSELRASLVLPAICAPMMRVSGPELVREACKSGIMAGLPRHNASSFEEFEQWLASIRADLDLHRAQNPGARIGPLAVNFVGSTPIESIPAELALCRRYGVELVITAMGNPTELVRIVHDWGGRIIHDVTSMRFAEKAIAAGVDGLTCIGSGGGGHSGALNALAFIPRVRQIWDGIIVLAGSVSNGATIRAAEILGADLAYLGTRFIATRESLAADAYKEMLVSETASGLVFTERVSGVRANWIKASLRRVGLDPADLPVAPGHRRYEHLPENVRPWRDIWSAGQGIELIDDVPSVAELVQRLRHEYVEACRVPDMADSARLVEMALDGRAA